jgi:hypothetical protein
MAKIKITGTQLAIEKFQEVINGSKEKVMEFFNNIDKYIEEKDYEILFKGEKDTFYYKKCKNVYCIFTIKSENEILIVDFLTETEFNKTKYSEHS